MKKIIKKKPWEDCDAYLGKLGCNVSFEWDCCYYYSCPKGPGFSTRKNKPTDVFYCHTWHPELKKVLWVKMPRAIAVKCGLSSNCDIGHVKSKCMIQGNKIWKRYKNKYRVKLCSDLYPEKEFKEVM